MKKILSILCIAAAFVFASKAMADDGPYGIYTGWSDAKNNGSWWRGGAVTAYTAFKDSSLSLSIERNTTDTGFSYGTFQYDSGMGQIVAQSEAFDFVGAGETGSSGVSMPYKANELAGVWVEIEGVKYYSQDSKNGGGHHTETLQVDAPPGSVYLFFDAGTSWPGYDKADIMILVTGVAPASSGAPLPGVLATVVLCSAVGGYLRRKKSAARIDQE